MIKADNYNFPYYEHIGKKRIKETKDNQIELNDKTG